MYTSSIFDSATDSTTNMHNISTAVPNDATALTSLTSKINAAKSVQISTSAADDDDVDSDHGVVMRDKMTKQG